MSAAHGQNLDWYFTQALTQPGFPVFAVRVETRGDSVSVELEQVQDAAWGVYRLPALAMDLGGTRLTIDVEGRTTRGTFAKPAGWTGSVTLDPDSWWLLEQK